MKKLFIGLLLLVSLVSCNSLKRAERRVERIAQAHPELVELKTFQIDTVLAALPTADTLVFSSETISETPVTVKTRRGSAQVSLLPSKEFQIVFQPDSVKIPYRDTINYKQIVIKEADRKNVTGIVLFSLWVVLLFVVWIVNKIRK